MFDFQQSFDWLIIYSIEPLLSRVDDKKTERERESESTGIET
jgi:hypothetical protein